MLWALGSIPELIYVRARCGGCYTDRQPLILFELVLDAGRLKKPGFFTLTADYGVGFS